MIQLMIASTKNGCVFHQYIPNIQDMLPNHGNVVWHESNDGRGIMRTSFIRGTALRPVLALRMEIIECLRFYSHYVWQIINQLACPHLPRNDCGPLKMMCVFENGDFNEPYATTAERIIQCHHLCAQIARNLIVSHNQSDGSDFDNMIMIGR